MLEIRIANFFGLEFEVRRPDDLVVNLKMDRVEWSIVETGKRNIIVNAFFMIGFPGETEEEVTVTIDLITRLMEYVHFPFVNIVRAYHGSAMYKLAKEMGYDEDFLMKHAMMPYGTQESIHSEYNFLPNEFLKESRMRVAAEFTKSERMQKMLRVQMDKFTLEELVWKYSTYFGSKKSKARRFLTNVLESMADSGDDVLSATEEQSFGALQAF